MARNAPRGLLRSLLADPDLAPERLVLFAVGRLGEPEWGFAERERSKEDPGGPAAVSAEAQRRAVRVSRIDGAISGCPFMLALVPAYVGVLWEQVRMALRIAAVHGRDTRDPDVAAELLWLRGVRPDLDSARAAIQKASAGQPSTQRKWRRGWRAWVAIGESLLITAGFLPPRDPSKPKPSRVRRAVDFSIGGVLYAMTWIFPVTFMMAMAYSCVQSTNTLAVNALAYYGGGRSHPEELPPRPSVPLRRRTLRALALGLSVGVPLAALAISAHSHPAGIRWYYVLAALLGVSLVIGIWATGARGR